MKKIKLLPPPLHTERHAKHMDRTPWVYTPTNFGACGLKPLSQRHFFKCRFIKVLNFQRDCFQHKLGRPLICSRGLTTRNAYSVPYLCRFPFDKLRLQSACLIFKWRVFSLPELFKVQNCKLVVLPPRGRAGLFFPHPLSYRGGLLRLSGRHRF